MTQIDGNIKNDDALQDSAASEAADRPDAARRGGGAWLRWLPLVLLFGVGATAWLAFDLGSYLSFDALAENRGWLLDQVERYELRTVLAFVFAYALATAFSIPGGAVLTVLGGFLFGTLFGTFYVVTGATLGAVAVFLAARTALGDSLRKRVGGTLKRMETGFRENALSYLLVLRLIPIFPFWLVNLVPAFLGVSLRTYLIGTILGIIPGTFVYASLGNGVGALFDQGETPDIGIIFSFDILTPILGLAVLALLPVAYKTWKARRAAAR